MKKIWSILVLSTLFFTITVLVTPSYAELNPGDILVIDFSAGTNGRGALFRVDRTTGTRNIISDFGLGFPRGTFVASLAIESSGNILVPGTDTDFSPFGDPAILYRVDPTGAPTSNRTVVSDFGNAAQGPIGTKSLFGIAIDYSGNALVVDKTSSISSPDGRGAVFTVDPTSWR